MGRDASTRQFYYLSGILPVRAQRCPPVMGWSGGRSASPMSVRDHPRRGIETPEIHMPAPCHPRTVGETAKPRTGTAVDTARPTAARHPHPARGRGRPHRPDRAPKSAPPKPTRCAASHVELRPPPRRPRPPPLPASLRCFRWHWPGADISLRLVGAALACHWQLPWPLPS